MKLTKKVWPFNLLALLLDEDDMTRLEAEINSCDKIKARLEFNLLEAMNVLCEREQITLRLRLQERKTLQAVGVELGLSGSRVSVIEMTAIYKLRRRNQLCDILRDLPGTTEIIDRLKNRNAKKSVSELEKKNKDLQRQLAEAIKRAEIAEEELKACEAFFAVKANAKCLFSERFNESHFGVRARNVLMRNSEMRSFSDLLSFYVEHGEDGFLHLRGLGEVSARNIVNFLRENFSDALKPQQSGV